MPGDDEGRVVVRRCREIASEELHERFAAGGEALDVVQSIDRAAGDQGGVVRRPREGNLAGDVEVLPDLLDDAPSVVHVHVGTPRDQAANVGDSPPTMKYAATNTRFDSSEFCAGPQMHCHEPPGSSGGSVATADGMSDGSRYDTWQSCRYATAKMSVGPAGS